jgi:hypothetical protein
MTHCDVSEYADVATDGALVALCDALVAHQQAHLVQIDLRGCTSMSDSFAKVALVDAVRRLPRLRHVRLDGCHQLSAETLRAFNALFRARAEERAEERAVADVTEKGSLMVGLRGKELSDEAAFRLCDAITNAGPGSALVTQLRTVDGAASVGRGGRGVGFCRRRGRLVELHDDLLARRGLGLAVQAILGHSTVTAEHHVGDGSVVAREDRQ